MNLSIDAKYPTYNGQLSSENTNYNLNIGMTTKVDKYKANQTGIHGTGGNVLEWTKTSSDDLLDIDIGVDIGNKKTAVMKKNKLVVLVKIETGDIYYPLSLLFLHHSLRKNGIPSKIIQINSVNLDRDLSDTVNQIDKLDPLFVGLSSMTGIQSHDAAIFSKALKNKNGNIPIVWGGIHPSLAPEDTIKQNYVDIVAVNEGEKVVVDISNAILNGDEYENIKGIYYQDQSGEIHKTVDQDFIDLNDYVLEEEDWNAINVEDSLEIDENRGTRLLGIQTSRGCPYTCTFCYNEKFTKLKMRYYSLENLTTMIGHLREKYNITDFMFVDDNIYFNKKRMFEIIEMINSKGGASTYLQMRVDDVSEESLKELGDLKAKRLFFGIESGSNSTKYLVKKKISNELILEKVKLISKYKDLAITCAFIVGLPTETESSIDETIKLAVKITDIHPNTVVTLQAYVPFPGTDLLEVTALTGHSMPDSPIGFKDYDSFDGNMDITWASYYGLTGVELSRKINIMNRYASLLSHNHSSTVFRTVAKKAIRVLAKYRLLNNYYKYPFEIYIQHKFSPYYIQLYKNKQELVNRLLRSNKDLNNPRLTKTMPYNGPGLY